MNRILFLYFIMYPVLLGYQPTRYALYITLAHCNKTEVESFLFESYGII